MSESMLPVEALQILVDKVVGKYTQGDIGLDEAASRLVGTGRFEENADALEFLRQEVCPKLEERLHSIEEEIATLQAEADRVRAVLGIGATNAAPPVPAQPYVPSGKGKKEKAAPEKKRKGAERAESIWDAHAEAPASPASDAAGASHAARDALDSPPETEPHAEDSPEPVEAAARS